MKDKQKKKTTSMNRRDFLKLGAVGTAIGAVTLPSKAQEAVTKKIDESAAKEVIKEKGNSPFEFDGTYKPFKNTNVIFAGGFFGFHPEDPDLERYGKMFLMGQKNKYPSEKKGWDQLGYALSGGSWAIHDACSPMASQAVSGSGILDWTQQRKKEGEIMLHNNWVYDTKYKFESKKHAADVIKRAATLYGASLVGITRRDKRWDYANFMDEEALMQGKQGDEAVYGHERFPFEPKTVIVMAFEMDYQAIAAAPTCVQGAGAGAEYSSMTKVAFQVSVFLKQLGYQAFACGNDTGLSVPYAIAAGLGEGSRMGTIVSYKYGPRVRLAKVYTDLEFVEYDKPIEFGVMEFCKNCMRCADACPSRAISYDKEPSFYPTHDNKDTAFYNSTGVKKYFIDAKKCFQIWGETGADCGTCIASCPYNKPDFWHHRLVDKITALMPGPVHDFMREMDEVFGYGDVDNPEKVDKFFDPKGRSYNGH